jgi:glutaminyl-peptide cyclotransferase
MNTRLLLWPALLALLLMMNACGSDAPPVQEQLPVEEFKPVQVYKVPPFDKDSAYAYVEAQVNFGPRVPNSPEHKACRDWLIAEFKRHGLEVIAQDFKAKAYDGTMLNSTNIIGQHNPAEKRRIVIAAHWDTRHVADSPINTERHDEPILGADDGASGVGVILELARVLKNHPIEGLGVDFVLFDAEDYGEMGANNPGSWGLGSQYWSRNLHRPAYRPMYGILLDMVGSKTPRFTKEKFSRTFAPNLLDKVWKLAQGMGHGNLFVDIPTGEVLDDHYHVNTIAKIPMIDIINKPAASETGFGHYWHTHDDNMDIISAETLGIVGQVMTAVIYREASGTF